MHFTYVDISLVLKDVCQSTFICATGYLCFLLGDFFSCNLPMSRGQVECDFSNKFLMFFDILDIYSLLIY